MRTNRFRGLLVSTVVAALAMVPAAGVAQAAGHDPAGNNGTVKIDGTPFDTSPDNEPHVGCVFQVGFYGFDEGDLSASVTFEAHPPTGQGVLLTDTVFIGEDDASGGGSVAGLDAERSYDLNDAFAAYTAGNQGYHVSLTVNADGSRGANTKHKTFWVTGCVPTGDNGGGDTGQDS
jgi:hypothetical protein